MKIALNYCRVLVLALLPSLVLAQLETPLEHRIAAVKVYANRALLTSTAQATVGAGTHLLVFSGLPYTLDRNSISASGEQTGGAAGVIQSVTFRISYLNRTPKTNRMAQLEDSVRILNNQHEELADRKAVLEYEQQLILKNDQTAGKDKGATAEELAKLSAFYRTRLGEIRTELTGIKRKTEYNRLRAHINEQQLNEARTSRDTPTYEVVVTYKANAAGRLALTLKYMVSGAGWAPKYDLRVEKVGKPMDMSLMADVTNQTGVDWNNVEISLSTANPTQGGTPPELTTQWLDFYVPRPVAMGREMRMKKATMAGVASAPAAEDEAKEGDVAMDEKAEATASSASFTTQTENALSVDYTIALPYTIASDGKPRQVDIRQFTLPTAYTLFAIPKLDRDAFLRASVGGWQDYNLLPGNANVYFEGSFLTTTYLNPISTEDTLQIGLGRDPRVLIKRERVKDFTAKKLIGGKMTATYGYTIEVRNNKKEAIQLVLEDQYPISRQNEIEVKLLSADGNPRNDVVSGKLTWRINLQPAETKKLQFGYEVKYPKDRPPVGL
jgi:uncharacterized protein (TIGR02231 family)